MKKKNTTITAQEQKEILATPEWEIPQIAKLKEQKALLFGAYSMADQHYLVETKLIDGNHPNYIEHANLVAKSLKLAKKSYGVGETTETGIKLNGQRQKLLQEYSTIPLPLTDTGRKIFTNYATLFNFFYQITGTTGKIGKLFTDTQIDLLPGVISVLHFIEAHASEIATPIDNNTKALFFNYIKDTTIAFIKIKQNDILFFDLLLKGNGKAREILLKLLSNRNEEAFWQVKDTEDKLSILGNYATKDEIETIKEELKKAQEKETLFTSLIGNLAELKNPYTPTQALTTTEYAEAYAITDKVGKAIMFSEDNFVEGTIAGLHYTANIAGAKLSKTELFTLAQISNLYLHKDTESIDITQTTPLLITFKEIQIAKRGGTANTEKANNTREVKKFEEQLRNLVTKRIKFKIDYTQQEATNKKLKKTQEVLFNRYNTIPEETYLLQADFHINPETKEKYLAITNKCIFLEICKKSKWIISIPHHFYNEELANALSIINLYEDTQATAYFLFMQLVSLIDDIVLKILKKKGHSTKVTRENIKDTELPPIKVRYNTLYNYGNPTDEYSTLNKLQKQRFRESIYKTLEAFGKIAKNHPNNFIEYPFLTLLSKQGITYKEYYDKSTGASIGIEFTINEAYKENFTTKMQNANLLTTPPKAIKKKAKQ